MHQDVYKKDSLYSKYFTEYENCDSDSRSCYIGIWNFLLVHYVEFFEIENFDYQNVS